MKITNAALIGLVNMLQHYMDKKLPQKISYAIMRNFTVLSEEYQFYSKQYQKLIEEFKDKIERDDTGELKMDSSGFPVMNSIEDRQEFSKPLQELLSIEIDVEQFTLDESDLDYEDSDRYDLLSPADLYNLRLLLCSTDKKNETK